MNVTNINVVIKAILDVAPRARAIVSNYSNTVEDIHLPGIGFIGVSKVVDNLPENSDMDTRNDAAAFFVSEQAIVDIKRKRDALKKLGIYHGTMDSPVKFLISPVKDDFHSDGERLTIHSTAGDSSTVKVLEKHSTAHAAFYIPSGLYFDAVNGEQVNVHASELPAQDDLEVLGNYEPENGEPLFAPEASVPDSVKKLLKKATDLINKDNKEQFDISDDNAGPR